MKQHVKENASIHWTISIINYLFKFTKEIYEKSPLKRSSTSVNAKTSALNYDKLNYVIKLLFWTYREGLIERDTLFTTLIEKLNIVSTFESQTLVLSVLVQYLFDIFSHPSSHRLIEFCHSKLSQV